jgi:hypothetical protein
MIIHISKEPHDELAIHAISNPAVSWNGIAKVFDFESTFETRGEETAEGSDEGGEGGEDEDVNLHGCHGEGFNIGEPDGKVVEVGDEDGIGGALEAGPDVCSEILGLLAFMQQNQVGRLTFTGQIKYL